MKVNKSSLDSINMPSNQYAFNDSVIGKGRPIIMIAGSGCSGDVWIDTANQLKDKYECHLITIPGYAGQKPIKEPILETTRNQIIDYVKDKNIICPTLMGHSIGGFLSLWIASSAPELFGKLIIVDGVPFINQMAFTDPDMDVEEAIEKINKKQIMNKVSKKRGFLYLIRLRREVNMLVSNRKQKRKIIQWGIASDKQTLALANYEAMTTDLRKKINQINIPVLILTSKHGSKEFTKRMFNNEYKYLKYKMISYVDCKHFIMFDRPEWFYHKIITFLE